MQMRNRETDVMKCHRYKKLNRVLAACGLMLALLGARVNATEYGACCFEVDPNICVDAFTQEDCLNQGGTFLGPDSVCDVDGLWCTTSIGACCFNSSTCVEGVYEDDCWWTGGEFFGNESTCANEGFWCITYYGACCFGEYCLEQVEEYECEVSGGIFWYGPCDEFSDIPECVASPRGACCVGGTSCETNVTELECDQMNGQYYGDDTTDCPATCAELVFGACCQNGDCNYMPDLVCLIQGGTFFPGEFCDPDTCTSCIGDLDGDGTINVNDLLALLAAFGLNDAGDCDDDGDTDINDVLRLIDAWGECP